ncbi:MAG: F0F1 ATP synthase subunit B [Planctomycetota bacterium]
MRSRTMSPLTTPAVLLTLAGLPAIALAADEGGYPKPVPGSTLEVIMPGLMTIIVFFVVLAFLALNVWPKITKSLDERNEKISSEIEAAEAARKQAKDALDEYERNLAEARAESQQMLEETRAKQGELAAELKAKADQELGAMRERAKADIETAKRAAINEIYAHSVTLASAMAGKILQREVTPEDQQRLIDETLSELGETKHN